MPEEEVTLDRIQWAEVLIALAKAENDEEASEQARERWGQTLEDIKKEVQITSADLVEWQETVYKGEEDA